MGITEILTVIFVILKLLGKIDWSWWLVLLPEILAAVGYILIWIVASIQTRRFSYRVIRSFKDEEDWW